MVARQWLVAVATLSAVGASAISSELMDPWILGSRQQKHLEFDAKLDYLVGILVEKKDAISEKIREYGEGTQSAYSRGIMANLQGLGLSFTTRGRNLQSVDVYLSQILSIADRGFGNGYPRITTMSAVMNEFQAATCNGANPKSGVINAVTSALETLASGLSAIGIRIPGIPSLVTSVFRCACASEWDFSAPAWQRLFDSLKALTRGDASTLESSLRACVPLLMGESGMCGTTCQTTLSDVLTWIVEVAEAASSVTIPLTLKTSYPENSVGCMCGGTIEWDSITALFSSRNIDRISSALGSPFGARGIFDAAGEFLDTIFGSGFMCGGQCPDSFADGVAISNYVGPRVAITQLRTAVGSSWPSSISASLAPTLDEVQAASTTFVSCLCALGYSTILDKVGGYVVSTGWTGTTDGVLNMVEDVMGTAMDGTPGSGGFCNSGHCPEFLARSILMYTRLGEAALTTNYGGFTPVDSSLISKTDMDTVVRNYPHCICSYFGEESTGDIFPVLRRKFTGDLPSGSDGWVALIMETLRGVYRASGLCSSGACRSVVSTLNSIVDGFATAGGGSSYCNSQNERACLGTSCFPLDGGNRGGSCSTCYQVPSGAQLPPFVHFDDQVDRSAYWVTCFMEKECPPEGVRGYAISMTFVIQATVDTFDEATFRQSLANSLGPAGSDIEGAVTSGQISLQVSGGSINVDSTINLYSPTVADTVVSSVNAWSPSTASAALGVTISSVSQATQTILTFAPPAPPPGPGADPYGDGIGDDTGAIPAWIWPVIGGVGGALLLSLLAACICLRRRRTRKKRSTSPNAVTDPSSAVAVTDGIPMAEPVATLPMGIPIRAKFCTNCGAELEGIFCSQCGAKNEPALVA